jgi:hypothetical protein
VCWKVIKFKNKFKKINKLQPNGTFGGVGLPHSVNSILQQNMVGRIGVTNTELMVKSRNTLSDVLKPWILHVEFPNGALSHAEM